MSNIVKNDKPVKDIRRCQGDNFKSQAILPPVDTAGQSYAASFK